MDADEIMQLGSLTGVMTLLEMLKDWVADTDETKDAWFTNRACGCTHEAIAGTPFNDVLLLLAHHECPKGPDA